MALIPQKYLFISNNPDYSKSKLRSLFTYYIILCTIFSWTVNRQTYVMLFGVFLLEYVASSPPAPTADGKFRKSPTASPATASPPFTAASTANILLSNCMNQFYPRPNLGFHSHAQQHSISKHFHHMLNQHNFLQNSSIAFDRTSIAGSLNLTTGYNHPHQDAITSATTQPHHLHQS